MRSVFVALCMLFMATVANAAELGASEATKILSHMGYRNIVVATVLNGAGFVPYAKDEEAVSNPNMAIVYAYAEREKDTFRIRETFLYNKEYGWHYIEIDSKGRKVRRWAVEGGYQEIKAQGAPAK